MVKTVVMVARGMTVTVCILRGCISSSIGLMVASVNIAILSGIRIRVVLLVCNVLAVMVVMLWMSSVLTVMVV